MKLLSDEEALSRTKQWKLVPDLVTIEQVRVLLSLTAPCLELPIPVSEWCQGTCRNLVSLLSLQISTIKTRHGASALVFVAVQNFNDF
jgi:hypothetical protein